MDRGNLFREIEKSVCEIMSDGKINSKDIPQLISVVQNVYQVIYSLKIKSNERYDLTTNIIKCFIKVMISEGKIHVDPENQEEFNNEMNALIDSCIGLLKLHKSIKPKKCLLWF